MGSFTAQGLEGLTVLHGPYFLTELFNFSVAGVVIIPIWRQGSHETRVALNAPSHCSSRPSWRHWVVGTRPSQHGFKPRHSMGSALFPISARVVSGFSKRKPPRRTIAIAVDISKAFETVSHRLLIEMIHVRFQLRYNLVRWLLAYPRGRKASCLYEQHISPPRQVRAVVPQGSVISLALFNHFVSDCSIPDLDMASYSDVMFSSTNNVLLWWGGQSASNWPLLPRNPAWHCSPLTPTSPDSTLRCELVTRCPRWIEPLKSWVSFWTSTSPLARDWVERASRALNIMKALAGLSWGFTTETLVATYKAIVRTILNYTAPIWFTQVSSSHLVKLEVIQNKAQRIATGCHQQVVAPRPIS